MFCVIYCLQGIPDVPAPVPDSADPSPPSMPATGEAGTGTGPVSVPTSPASGDSESTGGQLLLSLSTLHCLKRCSISIIEEEKQLLASG